MSEYRLKRLLEQFRLAIDDCQRVYLSSARRCIEECPNLIDRSPQEFVRLMDDLHKGLLTKIYMSVVKADRQWSDAEREFARVLFDHLWGRQLEDAELWMACEQVSRQASQLKWRSLIRPFADFAPLRDHIGELETVVTRVGNLVAKADGEMGLEEQDRLAEITSHLMAMQDELQRELSERRVRGPRRHDEKRAAGAQAVEELPQEADNVRRQCDLPPSEQRADEGKSPQERLDEALAELDGLIGIPNIKREVRTLVNFLKIQQERANRGLPTTRLSLHMVFHGNPGTGKTTVARIVGSIFGALGILQKGHLIETDRSGLVAEYAGQTAGKANKTIDEALDGVLFIDEAYSLVAESGDDPYGNEAVQTLLKRMEDDRDRLVVILAGYPEPMRRLLRSNPGLSSRFSRQVIFSDYSAAELGRIFEIFCRKNRYTVPAPVRAKLLLGFQWLLANRDEHFGNGRLVRNVFETAIRRLANRIVSVAELTEELLTTFAPDDVHLPNVPEDVWKDLDRSDRKYRIDCPGCGYASKAPQSFLGRRVQCTKCKRKFSADWGEPAEGE